MPAAARAGVKAKLGAFSVEVHAASAEELTLAAVIDKVRRATPVDGSEVHAGGAPEDAYSMDAFLAALAEEAAASAATFGDSGLVIAGGGDSHKSAAATIADIRSGSATNWGEAEQRWWEFEIGCQRGIQTHHFPTPPHW